MLSCSGERPLNLGVSNGLLAPCPETPNCVSSDASDPEHHVDGFPLTGSSGVDMRALREALESLPRTTVVEETNDYLRAECRSAVFRFIDDLELHVRVADQVVAVRSASRLGRSDLGVNRRRVERLRAALRERGLVR